MPDRFLPVRPNLEQLKRQAKDLLKAAHRGEAEALEDFTRFHPERIDPLQAQLADAQLVLARSYDASSWPRLVQCCELIDAIWRDDIDTVEGMITRHPHLLHENAGIRNANWGPPMSYAANIGRDRIIRMMHRLGAKDHGSAIDRATLQGRVATGRMLYEMAGSPTPPDGALAGPAYTLSVSGTAFALEIGARAVDEHGQRLAPVDLPLETDSRAPAAKHQILELYAEHGVKLPDTPTMALHRGRIDLLEEHLRRDPALLSRRFSHEEIYPPDMGCHDEINATQGTPLKGTTLLHLCVDYDELDIARWLIERGADVNATALVDADGFGGQTPLFHTVVSQPNFWINHGRGKPDLAPFTTLLLEHRANPNARASLRKQLHPGYEDPRISELRDVTPLGWGRRFHGRIFVGKEAMRLIEQAGGRE